MKTKNQGLFNVKNLKVTIKFVILRFFLCLFALNVAKKFVTLKNSHFTKKFVKI